MGQVIPFTPPPPAYPASTTALDAAESALLAGIRWWVSAYRHGEDPMPRLHRVFQGAGAPDAAFSVDALMEIAARMARRPIAVHCPHCSHLSGDEQQLLHGASMAQAGESRLAEHALNNALLFDAGAAFALGPLEGLSEVFAKAGLFFTRRRSPAGTPPPSGMAGAEAEPYAVH